MGMHNRPGEISFTYLWPITCSFMNENQVIHKKVQTNTCIVSDLISSLMC